MGVIGDIYEEASDSPDHTGKVQFRWLNRRSVTVKLNGVDRLRDGPAAVAPPLLLRLFVAE